MRNPMKIIICLGVLLVADVAVGQEKKTGTIRGVVRFTGKVPAPRVLPTGDGGTVEYQAVVVEPKTKGLRWVIAALEDAPAQPKLGEGTTPVVMDQKDMLFVPRVLAVQHGQPVLFDNSDSLNHSVTIFSAVKENEVNTFVTKKDPLTKSFTAEKVPLRIGCAIHPSMTAWLYVAPHPWVAVTDARGGFVIKDVPPGKYRLWLRQPDTRVEERREVEVKAGQTSEVEIEWKEAKPKPRK